MSSVLITERSSRTLPTINRTRSAAEAPVLGLKDYLETLEFPVSGGQHVRFETVVEHKAEPEDLAEYPGACVYIEGEVDYGEEEGSIGPYYTIENDIEDCTLIQMGECKASLLVHAWANEPDHRTNLVSMMEDAFNPVEFQNGFQLELPHYYNVRAAYILKQIEFEDNDSDNMRRYRKVGVRVEVRWPYVRLFRIPRLVPRSVVEVT